MSIILESVIALGLLTGFGYYKEAEISNTVKQKKLEKLEKTVVLVYSKKAAEQFGYIIAKKENAEEFLYTARFRNMEESSSYNWEDKEIVLNGKRGDFFIKEYIGKEDY